MSGDAHDVNQVREEHESFVRELRDLEFFVRFGPTPDPARWLADLVSRVTDLRPQIRRHFAWEDEIGFFQDLLAVCPEAAGQCEELRASRGDVLTLMDDVRREIDRKPTSFEMVMRLVGKIHRVVENIGRTEARELDLLFRAATRAPQPVPETVPVDGVVVELRAAV